MTGPQARSGRPPRPAAAPGFSGCPPAFPAAEPGVGGWPKRPSIASDVGLARCRDAIALAGRQPRPPESNQSARFGPSSKVSLEGGHKGAGAEGLAGGHPEPVHRFQRHPFRPGRVSGRSESSGCRRFQCERPVFRVSGFPAPEIPCSPFRRRTTSDTPPLLFRFIASIFLCSLLHSNVSLVLP